VFNSYYAGYLTVELLGSTKFLGDVTDVILLLIKPYYFAVFLGPILVWLGAIKLRRGVTENTASTEVGLSQKVRRIFGAVGIGLLVFSVLNPLNIPFFQSISSTEMISYHLKDILKHTTGYGVVEYEAEFEMAYKPDENDPLFGIAEGKNLIVIQAEALQDFVIGAEYNGQELTPVINELLKTDTIHFDNYYMQIAAGNTSDAEFATNNSIYGTGQSYTYEIYKDNAFRGLPWLLMERGYSTVAMHGYEGQYWSRNTTYQTQGFESFADSSAFKSKGSETIWGINDEDFFDQAVDYLKVQKQPFYSFLISLSNHTTFELPEELSSLELKEEHVGTMFGNYLNSVHYADEALGVFFKELKKAGLYEDSVIAIYGDHFGLSAADEQNVRYMTEYLGHEYRLRDAANIPLIIHIPGAGANNVKLPDTVSVAGGQTDFLPTMAYLMGFEELDTLYMGRNLLAEGQTGYVIEYRYANPGTYMADTYWYHASSDGLFQNGNAYDHKTGERLKLTDDMKELFQRSIGLSQKVHEVLEEDTIRDLYYSDGQPNRVDTRMVKRKTVQITPVVPTPEVTPIVTITDSAITSDGAIASTGAITSSGSITSGGAVTSEGAIVSGGAISGEEISGEELPEEETVDEPENDGGNVSDAVI